MPKCPGCAMDITWNLSKREYQCEHCGMVYSAPDICGFIIGKLGGIKDKNIITAFSENVSSGEDNLHEAVTFLNLGRTHDAEIRFKTAEDFYRKATTRFPTVCEPWFQILNSKTYNFTKIPEFKLVQTAVPNKDIYHYQVTPSATEYLLPLEKDLSEAVERTGDDASLRNEYKKVFQAYRNMVVSVYETKVAESETLNNKIDREYYIRLGIKIGAYVLIAIAELIFAIKFGQAYKGMIAASLGNFIVANLILIANFFVCLGVAIVGRSKYAEALPAAVNSIFALLIFIGSQGFGKGSLEDIFVGLMAILFFGAIELGVAAIGWAIVAKRADSYK